MALTIGNSNRTVNVTAVWIGDKKNKLLEVGNKGDQLDAEKVKVGVNWHGKNLSGYNVTVGQLRAGLQFYIEKYAKQHLLNSDT